jgi:hypothetical protein
MKTSRMIWTTVAGVALCAVMALGAISGAEPALAGEDTATPEATTAAGSPTAEATTAGATSTPAAAATSTPSGAGTAAAASSTPATTSLPQTGDGGNAANADGTTLWFLAAALGCVTVAGMALLSTKRR